jgi:CHAD domain-containing protein
MVQETGNRLITTFQKQIEKIIYFCTSENISTNLSVHEIRKSFKRMRALLLFYSESHRSYSDKYIFEIKAAGKVLSPVRESFVNIQLFERVVLNDSHIPERKIKQARDYLTEKNRLLIETNLVEKDFCGNIIRLIGEFENYTENMAAKNPSLRQIESQLAESYAQSSGIWMLNEPDFSADTFHELRKSLKCLWYQLDFVKFMHPRYFRMKSDQLNKITEQLGEDHDLFVFMEELKLPDYRFDNNEIVILENKVAHLREINMLKLQPRMKQIFNETPEMFNRKLGKIFRII